MGAEASVLKPLSEDELRALWDKHDSNGSGELELLEVEALLDDVRLRYGMAEPLPQATVADVFKQLDSEGLGFWTWHDFRQLGGESYYRVQRAFQRAKLRKNQRHNDAGPGKEDAAAISMEQRLLGAKAARATKKEVEAGEAVTVTFHPMRVSGMERHPSAWTFNPSILLRVVRGNPRLGSGSSHAAAVTTALEGPAVVESEVHAADVTDAVVFKDSIELSFKGVRGLYVHIIVKDSVPLADVSFSLEDFILRQESPHVVDMVIEVFAEEQACSLRADSYLVCQVGGVRPVFTTPILVHRGEHFEDNEDYVVELRMMAKDQSIVQKLRTETSARGPHPQWKQQLQFNCNDEGSMSLFGVVYRTRLTGEEAVCELHEAIHQEEIEPQPVARRRPLLPAKGGISGARITLAFGETAEVLLFVRPRSAGGIAIRKGEKDYSPYIKATICSQNPATGIAGVTICEAHTQPDKNCTADPEWNEPLIFEFVPEEHSFLHIKVCNSGEDSGIEDYDMAELIMDLEEVVKLQTAPMVRKYSPTLLIPKRLHADPVLFMSFGEKVPRLEEGELGGPGQQSPATQSGSSRPGQSSPGPTAAGFGNVVGGRQPAGMPSPDNAAVPLAQLLRSHGQPVPEALQPPTLAPSPMVARLEALSGRAERTQIQRMAQNHGGMMQGQVPLSFLNFTGNPHNQWMYRQPGR
eukprot:TRINITY_DN20503_c0_g1_i1.p1 TRINITY_DN20503_c0_g1~~TRINITY_DN20503_c0_g1_i1.p1  ORF type:complete len:693 (+),score=117.35 TRINITY_DN20503_c0_g1_i1:86-2164(+)